MVVTVHEGLRSLGKRPELPPLEPPRETGQRDRFAQAVSAARRELGARAGEGSTIDRALAKLEECEGVLGGAGASAVDPDPHELAELAVKGGNAKALLTPA